MNFDLTDDQRSIQRAARDFLAARYKPEEIRRLAYETERGFTDEGWADICELGWPALLIDEEHGGLGLGVVELAVVQEELGAALGALTVPVDRRRRRAHRRRRQRRAARALAAGPGRRRGARHGGLAARRRRLDRGARRRRRRRGRGARRRRLGAGRGRDRRAGRRRSTRRGGCGASPPTARSTRCAGDGARAADVIAVALGAESVGVALRTMEMAVAYAKEREQFGRPIGAYQAVSHACAQMLLEVEGARSVVLYAAWALDHEPESGPLAASMAKAYASDAGWRVPAAALQVHGGIGFTWEHDLHLWLKRGKANAYLWGDAREHRARVADLIGL